MKALKYVGIALGVWVAIVVVFESMIGILQPDTGETITIVTQDADGEKAQRVLARLENGGQIFIAANHWPRAWYNQALENPAVEGIIDGETKPYTAVPVSDAEHERLQRDHDTGLVFRFITGFPPRYFLRLDPR